MFEKVPQTDFSRALQALTSEPIEFIVIGGLAAIIHGAGRSTYDVDVSIIARRRIFVCSSKR